MKQLLLLISIICNYFLNAEVYQLQEVKNGSGTNVAVSIPKHLSLLRYASVAQSPFSINPSAITLKDTQLQNLYSIEFIYFINKVYEDTKKSSSNSLFDSVNNARFPETTGMPVVWQMPGLAVFVPSVPITAQSPLPIDYLLNWGNHNSNFSTPFETILMAKKRVTGYNPSNPAPNPWGSLFLNALIGVNGFLPVDYRSHTERQLVAALLNDVIKHNATAGDLYVYTEENPCTNPTPCAHNQGIPCIRFYEGLSKHFKNIKFHVFFKKINGDFLNNLSIQEIEKLMNFIASYPTYSNEFPIIFPHYRIVNGVLVKNNELQIINNLLKMANIKPDDIKILKTNLKILGIDIDNIYGYEVTTTNINPIENNSIRITIQKKLNSVNIPWNHAITTLDLQTLISTINILLGDQITSIPCANFRSYLRNGIFQAVFGSDNINYHYL